MQTPMASHVRAALLGGTLVSIEGKLQIRCWSEQEFEASQAEWQGLPNIRLAEQFFIVGHE